MAQFSFTEEKIFYQLTEERRHCDELFTILEEVKGVKSGLGSLLKLNKSLSTKLNKVTTRISEEGTVMDTCQKSLAEIFKQYDSVEERVKSFHKNRTIVTISEDGGVSNNSRNGTAVTISEDGGSSNAKQTPKSSVVSAGGTVVTISETLNGSVDQGDYSVHAYNMGIKKGTIRYVKQDNKNSSVRSQNGWDYNGSNSSEGGCGYASQSMAMSYLGVDAPPGKLRSHPDSTGYTRTYGYENQVSVVGGSGNQGGRLAVQNVSRMLDSFIEDNGKGDVSPVIIHYHSTTTKYDNSNIWKQHAIIIVGKQSDGSYLAIDTAKTAAPVRLTISDSGSIGGNVTYGGNNCIIDGVQQYKSL